jgi:hypothetical protein
MIIISVSVHDLTVSPAKALAPLRRFSIVNPTCHRWGASDWFAPYYRADVDGIMAGYWVSSRDLAIYHDTDLTPSVPRHRTAEGFRLRLAAEACAMERADAIELSGRHPLSV